VNGYGIRVGIIDTGIDYTHPDLGGCFGAGCKVALGYDFVNGDNNPMDDHGHGTHVAGIVAAEGGVVGVAPEATLAAYKVCSAAGSCYYSYIIAALEQALADELDIVNISIGGVPVSADNPLIVATNNAVDAGLVVVVAAGNEGLLGYRSITTPGLAEKALTVGAADAVTDTRAFFSSRGPVGDSLIKPDIIAPGMAILSTYLGHGYREMDGTSMASPHAAGAAALLLQLHPNWTPSAVKGSLMANAKRLYPFDGGSGFMRVDQAANAPLLIQPASLNMGRVDDSQPLWTADGSQTLTNLSTETQQIQLSVLQVNIPAGVSFVFSEDRLSLRPGQTTIITFTVTIDPAVLPYPTVSPYVYSHYIQVDLSPTYYTYLPFSYAPPARDCQTQSQIPVAECQALVTFYEETGGENWWWRGGWLDTPPCGWVGVACYGGHVGDLVLFENNLNGQIPAALGSLTELEVFNANFNHLNGPLPAELGSLTKLRHIILLDNDLAGPLPPELGNLAHLEQLTLMDNQISGPIPAWLGSLTSLSFLNLGGNPLTGSIPPELGNLTNLKNLLLDRSNLSGPIPAELGNLTKLEALHLYNNALVGTIPASMGNLTHLRQLTLYGNQLTGPIPAELGNLTNLEVLWLHRNDLTGLIPPELGQLSNLGSLYLYENHLDGPLPEELGNLINLNHLRLDNNSLDGEIPASLANLTGLSATITNFGYNALSATDPILVAFLNTKDPDWYLTQTLPPENLTVRNIRRRGVTLSWTPIPYTGDGGYYEVGVATTPGGPYNFHRHTASKLTQRFIAANLQPGTTYYFVVRTFTPSHGQQENALTSGPGLEVTATTLP
jgi:Leucine-rich repeat (LRR) protein